MNEERTRELYEDYLRKHELKQNKGAKGTRDSERKKTYESEWGFEHTDAYANLDLDLKSVEGVEKFVRRVVKSKMYFQNGGSRYKKIKVGIKHYRNYSGKTDGRTIWLSKNYLNKYVVLHELAHTMGHMHHGRSFRKCLLALVSRFLGTEAAKALKTEFKKRKLAFGNERQPMGYGKWIENRERMKKMRKETQLRKEQEEAEMNAELDEMERTGELRDLLADPEVSKSVDILKKWLETM